MDSVEKLGLEVVFGAWLRKGIAPPIPVFDHNNPRTGS